MAEYWKVLLMGTINVVPSQAGVKAAWRKVLEQPLVDMPASVLRVSVHEVAAKNWKSKSLVLSSNVFAIKLVARAGRAVMYVESKPDSSKGKLHAFYFKDEASAQMVADNVAQACFTVSAALKEIRLAGGAEQIAAEADDDKSFLKSSGAGARDATYGGTRSPVKAGTDRFGASAMNNIFEDLSALAQDKLLLGMLPQEGAENLDGGGGAAEGVDEPPSFPKEMELGQMPPSRAFVKALSKQIRVNASRDIVFHREPKVHAVAHVKSVASYKPEKAL